MSRYTPGPWRMGEARANGEVLIYGYRQIVASAIDMHREYTAEANARLIAAAPELLEVLEEIVEMLELGVDPWGALKDAHAAIAKARGEEDA